MRNRLSLPGALVTRAAHSESGTVWPRVRPTYFGWTLLVLILLSWLMAVNYSNNLLYAVVCLWLSLLAASLLLVWLSFRQVRILGWQHQELFAGLPNPVRLSFDRAGFVGQLFVGQLLAGQLLVGHDKLQQECLWRCVPARPGRQSLQAPALCATDALGLWQVSRPLPALTGRMVFAQPIAHLPLDPKRLGVSRHQEPDDIAGLRDYQSGDAWRHIDWKASARRGGLVSRQWQGEQSADLYALRWQALETLSPRQRQETLSAWVINLFERQQDWSLQLPGVTLGVACGWQHRQQSLGAIAEVPV